MSSQIRGKKIASTIHLLGNLLEISQSKKKYRHNHRLSLSLYIVIIGHVIFTLINRVVQSELTSIKEMVEVLREEQCEKVWRWSAHTNPVWSVENWKSFPRESWMRLKLNSSLLCAASEWWRKCEKRRVEREAKFNNSNWHRQFSAQENSKVVVDAASPIVISQPLMWLSGWWGKERRRRENEVEN